KAVGRPSPSKLSIRPPVNPAGNALRFSIDRRSQSAILRREVASRWARDCYNGSPPERRQRREREDDSIMLTSVKRRQQPARASKRPIRPKPGKPARAAAKPARSRGPAPKPTVIDVHAHVLVPEVMKRTYEHSQYARAVAGPGGVPEPLFQRMTD